MLRNLIFKSHKLLYMRRPNAAWLFILWLILLLGNNLAKYFFENIGKNLFLCRYGHDIIVVYFIIEERNDMIEKNK